MKIADGTFLQLTTPNWAQTRPIYKKLSDEFHILLDAYNITLDVEKKVMLDHLILGIDAVDKCIDEITDQYTRNAVCEDLILFLEDANKELSHECIDNDLSDFMAILKQIVMYLNIEKRFIGAVRTIFYYTEMKRHVKKRSALIEYVSLEGRATAELPLSIMSVDPQHKFAKFFTTLCMLMGIMDLIVDARSDYKLKYISVRPNLVLHFRLIYILVISGIKMIFQFPQPFKFIGYCLRFSRQLIAEANTDKNK